MNKNINCFIVTSKLSQNRREKKEDSSISKEKNSLNITYCENDSIEKFEEDVSSLIGKNKMTKQMIKSTVSEVQYPIYDENGNEIHIAKSQPEPIPIIENNSSDELYIKQLNKIKNKILKNKH